jgi:glucosamine--fructose-6-phosphate aminotransferase (isomerizing)
MELKARGGRVIGVAAQPQAVFDDYIEVADCGPATLIPQVAAIQVLAYELALLRNIDPDKPRNLAKSVTVG